MISGFSTYTPSAMPNGYAFRVVRSSAWGLRVSIGTLTSAPRATSALTSSSASVLARLSLSSCESRVVPTAAAAALTASDAASAMFFCKDAKSSPISAAVSAADWIILAIHEISSEGVSSDPVSSDPSSPSTG